MAEDEELPPRIPKPGRRSATPEEYGSIIERFRGTEWETKPAVDPLLLPPSGEPSRSGALVALGVVGIVVVIGLSIMLVSPRQAAPLAPPGAATLPSSRPTPTYSDENRVVDAFWATVGASDASYHLDADGTTMLGTESLAFAFSLDVVGDDYVGAFSDSRDRATLIRKAGTVYARLNGGDWLQEATDDAILRQVPFLAIRTRTELAYYERVQAGQETQHHLRSTPWFAPDLIRLLGFTSDRNVICEERSLEILVSDAGVPIHASFRCARTYHLVGGQLAFSGVGEFSYSAWGEPVEITAPAVR